MVEVLCSGIPRHALLWTYSVVIELLLVLRAAFSSLFSKYSTQKAWLYQTVLQLGMMQEFPGNVKEDFSEAAYDENWMVALDFRKLK